MTARLLEGCVLYAPATAAPGLAEAHQSLRYQAWALGIGWQEAATDPDYVLRLPQGGQVRCELTLWPDHKAPGSEFTLQAATGLMSIHGRARHPAQALGLPYLSCLTAALALQGLLAAALGQLRGGQPGRVSLSMAAAAMLAVGQYLAGATAPEAPEQLLPGACPMALQPPFCSADGIWFELETLEAGPWRAFWQALGVTAADAGKGWNGFLQRYAKAIAPLPAALPAALAQRTFDEIVTLAAESGLAVCRLRSLEDRVRDIDARALWQQGPWHFTFAAPTQAPVARSGGLEVGRISRLPLAGLQLVESCRRIQGPLAGHLLACLGAEVTRIEPPGGDPLRAMPPLSGEVSARFDALNRLKRVTEIDIRTAEGRQQVYQLTRLADVFLHNWAPGKAEALRLDAATLRADHPALIYAYAGGWGPQHGPDLPGTDFMAQAWSGVAEAIGRAAGVAGGSLFTVLDVLGGVVAAQGVVAALLQRQLTGAGGQVETSLLGAASLLCADSLSRLLTGLPAVTPAANALQAVFSTRQGRLAIDCPDRPHLLRALQLPADTTPTQLADHLLGQSAEVWQAQLQAAGIAASRVVEDLCDLPHDPRLHACLTLAAYVEANSPWRFQ